MNDNSDNKASLGCGTLILIAIIVAIFSNGDTKKELRQIESDLDSLQAQLLRIEQKLDALPPPAAEAPETP